MISPYKAFFSGPKCSILPSVSFTLKERNLWLGNKQACMQWVHIWEFPNWHKQINKTSQIDHVKWQTTILTWRKAICKPSADQFSMASFSSRLPCSCSAASLASVPWTLTLARSTLLAPRPACTSPRHTHTLQCAGILLHLGAQLRDCRELPLTDPQLQASGGGGLCQAHLLEVWFRLRSWAWNRCLKSWSVAVVVAGGRRRSMIHLVRQRWQGGAAL
jgi:hypothetical protein